MKRLILTVAAVLAGATAAPAQCGTAYRSTYVAPTYAKTYSQTYDYAPVFLAFYGVPTFGVSFQPPPTVAVAAPPVTAAVQTQTTTTAAAAATMPPAMPSAEMIAFRAQLNQMQAQVDRAASDAAETRRLLTLAFQQANGGGTGQNPPQQIPPEREASAVNLGGMTKCASCHVQGRAAAKGGGFAFLTDDGRRLPLTERQEARIDREVKQKTMPPPEVGKLTDAEIADILGRQRTPPPAKP